MMILKMMKTIIKVYQLKLLKNSKLMIRANKNQLKIKLDFVLKK